MYSIYIFPIFLWNRFTRANTNLNSNLKKNILWNTKKILHLSVPYLSVHFCYSNITDYLTLYTFSFEIKESWLSDTRCLIQDVVSPHYGDKRMARRCTRRSLPNYFDMTSYHWNVKQNTVTGISERTEKITWRHAQNEVFLRVLYKF